MASNLNQPPSEDLKITGVSRRGRVRKKSSKLTYFDFDNRGSSKDKSKLTNQKIPKQSKHMENVKKQAAADKNHCANKSKKSSVVPKKNTSNCQVASKKRKSESSPESSSVVDSENDESSSTMSNNGINTPDYTSSDEQSFDSDDELLNSKVKMPTPEAKKTYYQRNTAESKISRAFQTPIYTGYQLWSKETKKEILKKYPYIDNAVMTIRLGEMWTRMSVSERNHWHIQAQSLTEKYEFLKKQSIIGTVNSSCLGLYKNRNIANSDAKESYRYRLRVIELQPINIAAYLKLLGENVALIGAKLKGHNEPVDISNCITVLLDSLICAMGSLLCLTQQVSAIQVHSLTFFGTLENIAYIMPGL